MKKYHEEKKETSNSYVYKVLQWIEDGSKEWIEYDVKEDRDKGSQRSWKKFRKTQYKVLDL